MSATVIAWILVTIFGSTLSWLLVKYGRKSQHVEDTKEHLENVKTILEIVKKADKNEQEIKSKPLPMDTNSVIDRLPE